MTVLAPVDMGGRPPQAGQAAPATVDIAHRRSFEFEDTPS
jgi:hypothetical protein